MDTGIIPAAWSKIFLTMIYKKRGDISDPNNCRGISLVNNITKIFTQILASRLTDYLKLTGAIPESQSGFRPGRGCVDNLYTINALIQTYLSRKNGKVFIVFIDFVRAFDTVNHNSLWEIMAEKGISSRFIQFCQKFIKMQD